MSVQQQLERVNKELWLVLSLFAIALLINLVSAERMVLAFYTLPTVFSAYMYGRRHATLTATASVLLVYFNPLIFAFTGTGQETIPGGEWLDIAVWGGTLIVTGHMMGTLYEAKDAQLRELRETYHGI